MKTFTQALLEALSKKDAPSLRSLAEATGVSYEQLKKVKQGKTQNTNVEDARKIATHFGQKLEEFIDCPEMKGQLDLADALSQLDEGERLTLLAVARARIEEKRLSALKSDEES